MEVPRKLTWKCQGSQHGSATEVNMEVPDMMVQVIK
jgi:hypothetical protein